MTEGTLPLPKCRVCRGSEARFLCDTPNEHSKSRVLHHYQCIRCGAVFVGNEIDNEELGAAYATLDSTKYYEEIENENRRKMTTATHDVRCLASPSDRLIDIGTGNGLFIRLLHESGMSNLCAHEIPGCDLSAISSIAQQIYQDYDYSTLPADGFDIVTMLDVVEHVPDPRRLMDACRRVLKKNGVVYFHVPVVSRLDRAMHLAMKVPFLRKIGRIWQRGRTSVFHLQIYTPKAIRHLLEKAGFRDIQITVVNELSWPVSRYIRVYLLEKLGLPRCVGPLLLPVCYPLLVTRLLNANKAVVSARRD